jgi:hypothetical protein
VLTDVDVEEEEPELVFVVIEGGIQARHVDVELDVGGRR